MAYFHNAKISLLYRVLLVFLTNLQAKGMYGQKSFIISIPVRRCEHRRRRGKSRDRRQSRWGRFEIKKNLTPSLNALAYL